MPQNVTRTPSQAPRLTALSGLGQTAKTPSASGKSVQGDVLDKSASKSPVTLAAQGAVTVKPSGNSLVDLIASQASEVKKTRDGQQVTFRVLGKQNAIPAIPKEVPTPKPGVLDTVIIGGGLSGMTALWHLKDKNALLLEYNDETGGLAAQSTKNGVTYARGAAYFTKPEDEVLEFYKELGLGSPKKVEIKTPIDSWWEKGKLVKDIWEHGLKELPEEFADFKDFLITLDDNEMIGVVPFENQTAKVKMFDKISAAELVEPYGTKVKALIDLYCQSALGAKSEDVSAMAFLNFYYDELGPRYAFPGGSGGVGAQLRTKLEEQKPGAMKTGMFVYDVHHRTDGLVEVRYMNKEGKAEAVLAKQAIVTTPVSTAAKIIKDLPAEQKDVFESVQHANYLVHNVFTPKSLFDESYDTWTRGLSFTDVIVGRWQEATIGKKDIPKEGGILTVYQPLPKTMWGAKLSEEEVRREADKVLRDLKKVFPEIKKEKALAVESNRWPQSIHITRPGLMTEKGEIMRKPHGNITFAGMNMGVPSFEEAIIRGMKAADRARTNLAQPAQADVSAAS